MAATTTLDLDPLSVECPPAPQGCGQPAGHRCTSIGRESFGQPLRRPHWRRQVRAGAVLPPTRPDELDDAPLRRSATAAGQRRAQGGRIDWAGDSER